ncbi:hypothetical protein B0F90DRAFT_1276361 [Multifurca ochricompacta]|uniref:Uncharacterized protein n=1 Tax=Multifurca ochricompacta TaxID=376703 RepID=A0AAD4LYQ5_9AGAM|nr:hypothetical protein B0F90DRAFT_1276361 [Multifurca ochricompacta]
MIVSYLCNYRVFAWDQELPQMTVITPCACSLWLRERAATLSLPRHLSIHAITTRDLLDEDSQNFILLLFQYTPEHLPFFCFHSRSEYSCTGSSVCSASPIFSKTRPPPAFICFLLSCLESTTFAAPHHKFPLTLVYYICSLSLLFQAFLFPLGLGRRIVSPLT